jgi:hypothetical protein
MYSLAHGHVDCRDAYFVSSVHQNLCRSIGVLQTQIGEQDMLTYADPPGDGLANLS